MALQCPALRSELSTHALRLCEGHCVLLLLQMRPAFPLDFLAGIGWITLYMLMCCATIAQLSATLDAWANTFVAAGVHQLQAR